MSRRVVITGGGVVSTLGVGVKKFWSECLSGRVNVAGVPENWPYFTELHSRIWSPILDFDPELFGVARTERFQFDPVTVLALGVAREAIEHAGLTVSPAGIHSRNFVVSGLVGERAGVFFGTGLGGAITFLQNHTHHVFRKPRANLLEYIEKLGTTEDRTVLNEVIAQMSHGIRFNPFEVSMVMPNAPSAAIGIKYNFTGPNQTYCVACASGTVAVGNAFRAVRAGYVDIAISGGCEYFADEKGHIFRSFDVSGTLVRDYSNPETANRPFDIRRSGFLFSQGGAAALLLEELGHAQRRGAPIIAEVIGFGETFDAHSMMSLAPGGIQIERMIRSALMDAAVSSEDVDYVNAHGTGTRNNDEVEATVIDRVFGKSVRINSTKSLLGHTIGASGAFEALVTALTLRDGMTHVCKNLDEPVHDLNFVRTVDRFDPRVGITQSFAFGGHNAGLVLRRFDQPLPQESP